ncbi:MAG: hypothetical protein PHE59_02595 [Patescibacteria group bacterium]|nr:hypothetical protein [Patescibacteria group bacterium]MDD5164349.1 hypothetical protein [Patescibacteria group bacterium]MDD5534283.1 hypothetical protein [Patescibacteria group bacterium]
MKNFFRFWGPVIIVCLGVIFLFKSLFVAQDAFMKSSVVPIWTLFGELGGAILTLGGVFRLTYIVETDIFEEKNEKGGKK